MDSLIWILIIFFIVVPFINQIIKAGKTVQSRKTGSATIEKKPEASPMSKLISMVIILAILGVGAALLFSGEIKNTSVLVTVIIIFFAVMSIIKNARKSPATTTTQTPSFLRLDPLRDQMHTLRSLQSPPYQRVEVIQQLQAKGDQSSRNLILRTAVHDPDVLVQNKAFQALSELMGGADKAEYAINAFKAGKPDDEPWFLPTGTFNNPRTESMPSSYADQNIDPFQNRVVPAKWIMIFLLVGLVIMLGVVMFFLAAQ
jgi:hypothetical protein